MAKKAAKSTKSTSAEVNTKKIQETKDESLNLNGVEDSSSEEELSSDEDIEMEGLEQSSIEGKAAGKGHTVNLTKDDVDAPAKSTKKRGVVYIGRLPKLFQEYEVKKYFSQFGDILRLRISRNKTTGASRHYGFLEFKDYKVAKIAAETMNNYLLLGHLLKVHVVEDPKDNLFSKNLRNNFREYDWKAKKYADFHKAKPAEEWEKLQKDFEKKKEDKIAELKTLGFDYALEA